MKDTTIKIVTQPRFKPLRMVLSVMIQVGIFAIGIAANSPAMQWCAFFMLFIGLFALAATETQKNSGLTIAQARAKLDELEAAQ